MKKTALFLLIVFIHFFVNSQVLPQITPPSPESASLAKFEEIPISYYTGIPNIQIPISSLTLEEKTIPISINYHARGVKVDEIASRIGIGWSLNAGGSITRKARGLSDEHPIMGYLTNTVYMDESIWEDENLRADIASQITANPEFDLIPDVFILQAPGISCNFIIDKRTGLPLIQKYDDIQITIDFKNGKIDGFEVIDSRGFIYYFGNSKNEQREAKDIEIISENIYVARGQYPYFTSPTEDYFPTYNSWKLLDIESPSGQVINFYYEFEEIDMYRHNYDKIENNVPVAYISHVTSKQYQLEEIIHRNGSIVFEKEFESRLDLRNAHALDKIKIFDKTDKLIKIFDFENEYNDSPSSDFNQLGFLRNIEPEADKRLMLTKIFEMDSLLNSLPPYVFGYDSQPLPNRFSTSQDYWGYYNGKDNGQYLTFFDYGSNHVDRRVDELKSMAGLLKSIIYPTGGSTVFHYEHNTANPEGQLVDLFTTYINPEIYQEDGISHLDFVNNLIFNGTYYSKEIVFSDEYEQVNVSIGFSSGESNCSASVFLQDCPFQIVLYLESGGYIELFKGSQLIYIPGGTHTLKVFPQGIHDPINNFNDGFTVALWWNYDVINQNELVYTSGKRIKKIEYKDENQQVIQLKTYEYLDSNGDSSGRLLGIPNFYEIDTELNINGGVVLKARGSVPGSPTSTSQQNTIGYVYVTEYLGNETQNQGKIEYEFSMFHDSGDFMTHPYHVPNDHEWLRGLPRFVKYYKMNNGIYNILKEIETEYIYGNFLTSLPESSPSSAAVFAPIPIRKYLDEDVTNSNLLYDVNRYMFRFPLVIFYQEPHDAFSDIEYKTYYQTGGTLNKLYTIEKDYYDNGLIVKKTDYGYSYDLHYQINQIEISGSNGLLKQTAFEYPTNPSMSGEPNVGTMASKNMIAYPLNTKHYSDINNDGQITSSELESAYKKQYIDLGNGRILLGSVLTSKGSVMNFEERIIYHSYDVYGNPLEMSKADGTHIVYIWGYNQQYPIAKIENAAYSQVQSYVTNLQFLSDADDDHCLDSGSCDEKCLRMALNTLRSSLPNALVTTYTYDPLIGVTSITDPRGDTIYYEYDDFNRLKHIKDSDGNILSKNEYHYSNQN